MYAWLIPDEDLSEGLFLKISQIIIIDAFKCILVPVLVKAESAWMNLCRLSFRCSSGLFKAPVCSSVLSHISSGFWRWPCNTGDGGCFLLAVGRLRYANESLRSAYLRLSIATFPWEALVWVERSVGHSALMIFRVSVTVPPSLELSFLGPLLPPLELGTRGRQQNPNSNGDFFLPHVCHNIYINAFKCIIASIFFFEKQAKI